MLHGPKSAQHRAQKLRRAMTLPEIVLWRALRDRPANLRFRHQHPAGVYVLDFFCLRHRLAVEVDGEAHSRGDQPDRDAVRDRWLAGQDVRTIRVPANAVLADLDAVIRHIVATARPELPLHQPLAGPPPPPGED